MMVSMGYMQELGVSKTLREELRVANKRIEALERCRDLLEQPKYCYSGVYCISCERHRDDGHAPDCEIAKALEATS